MSDNGESADSLIEGPGPIAEVGSRDDVGDNDDDISANLLARTLK